MCIVSSQMNGATEYQSLSPYTTLFRSQPLAAAVEVLEQSTTAAGADKASPVNSIPNTPFIFALLIVLDLRSRRHVAVGWVMTNASRMPGKEFARSLS